MGANPTRYFARFFTIRKARNLTLLRHLEHEKSMFIFFRIPDPSQVTSRIFVEHIFTCDLLSLVIGALETHIHASHTAGMCSFYYCYNTNTMNATFLPLLVENNVVTFNFPINRAGLLVLQVTG